MVLRGTVERQAHRKFPNEWHHAMSCLLTTLTLCVLTCSEEEMIGCLSLSYLCNAGIYERNSPRTKTNYLQQHSKTTNELWLMFKDAITKAAQKYIPSKICKKRDRLPYITPELVKLIKRRDRVYKKRQRAKRNFNHSATGYQNADKKLKQLKKEIQTKLRQAYWSYIESIITPVENDSGTASGMKRFWQFVKSKRKERVGVATLKVDGKSVSNPRDKANELNKQFESVFTREGPLSNDLLPDQSPHPTMSDIDITEPGVRKMLEKLNVHKAQGPDEIGPQILKNLASTIAPILTVIYRRSYETGRIPEDWRMANVVPAYKKGKNSLPSNYRPISLTCIAC